MQNSANLNLICTIQVFISFYILNLANKQLAKIYMNSVSFFLHTNQIAESDKGHSAKDLRLDF